MKNIVISIFIILFIAGCESSEDKIYSSFKCSKAATLLEEHIKAKMALHKAEAYFKDVHSNEALFAMQLNQRFQDEFELYKYNSSSQIEIISELYNSSECKSMYESSDIPEDLVNQETSTNVRTQKSIEEKIISSNNLGLEEIFKNFNICDFPKISYDISNKETTHPYFKQKNITPYKVEQSLAHYSVDDSLFGIHVSHLVLPVTWNFVSITFDLPIDEVRPKLSTVFGEGFEATSESDAGHKPFLVTSKDDPSKTIFYCDEPDYE